MKFINPSFKLIQNDNQLKTVEYCARLCYKSDKAIIEKSYIDFCLSRFKEKHYAIFEHANFTFEVSLKSSTPELVLARKDRFLNMLSNLYGVTFKIFKDKIIYVLNLRHIFELCDNGDYLHYSLLPDDVRIFEYPTENIHAMESIKLVKSDLDFAKFYTVEFNTQRAIWDELARHRRNALCCESSRYCNYSKEKFDGEIKVSKPYWFKDSDFSNTKNMREYWLSVACESAEENYMRLIKQGFVAQDARYVLPLGYNVNCIVTASLEQWKHIFDLRCSYSSHPDMNQLMNNVRKVIIGD